MGVRAQEYRRGWTVILSSAMGSGVGVAVLAAYSLGAFIEPLTQEFGWTRAEVTAAALFKSIAVLLAGAGVGALADRYGARRVVLISQVLLAVSFAGMSQLTGNVWTLYVGYFLFAILGAGTLPMIWSRAIVGWFSASRGVALGLSLVGTGIVGALLPSYVSYLVEHVGWRGAYIGVGALPLVLGLPFALLFFREPEEAPVKVGDAPRVPKGGYKFVDALKTACFWQMALSFIIVSVAISGLLVHALPLLTDRGVDRGKAAAVAGLFGLAVTFGRLIAGYFLDVFRGPKVAAILFTVPAAGLGVLYFAGDNLWLCAAAILAAGLAAGTESDVAGYLVAKYFGRANYGATYGLLYTLFGIGGGLGPFIVGAVFDAFGDYQPALIGGMVIFLVAALLIGTVRPPPPYEGQEAEGLSHAAPFSSARRVTTGVDGRGRAVIVADETIVRDKGLLLAWAADAPPVTGDPATPPIAGWWPPPGGVRVTLSTRAPEDQAPASSASAFPDINDAAGFHASRSVDVVVMISGRIWLELDDGVVVELAAGDVLVQNGARHRWRNPGPDWPLMAVVIVGAADAAA